VSSRTDANRLVSDINGAFGELGTFISHVVGAITVAAPAPSTRS
jgi:hypothetical protein